MKYGLVGKSLIHSYSKQIHESLGKYEYELLPLESEDMVKFVKDGSFNGLNVTIPYKRDVIPLCGKVSKLAADIGAVNTLYWTPSPDAADRVLTGHNTDYEGFVYCAERAGIDLHGKTALILGTGGTSLMVRRAVADLGADRIYIASRSERTANGEPSGNGRGNGGLNVGADGVNDDTRGANVEANRLDNEIRRVNAKANDAKAERPVANAETRGKNTGMGEACADMRGENAELSETCAGTSASRSKISPQYITYARLDEIAKDVQIVINTTPVGTYPDNLNSVITLSDLPNCEAVIDVIYNPFKTKLLFEAESRGLKFSNGLPMLVAQATAAAGYFLGTPGAFIKENERIIAELTARMRNIVLIGMPGSGKSTIGRLIAEQTGKRFVDMDDEIVKRTGISIPEIFNKYGEAGFRDTEAVVAGDLGKERGLVIATGGGAVLRAENVTALRQNGLVVHVSRPVSGLPTEGRPLSKNTAALEEMETVRMPIYKAAADITFDNSTPLTATELADKVKAFCENDL